MPVGSWLVVEWLVGGGGGLLAGSPGCENRDGLISDEAKLRGEPDEHGKLYQGGRGFKKVFLSSAFCGEMERDSTSQMTTTATLLLQMVRR